MLREGLVRLQDDLFGTRLMRGVVAPGGVRRDVAPGGLDRLRTHLDRFDKEFGRLITLLIDAGSFTDRVDGTGILTTQAARDLGIVGLAARASGLDTDFRRDHPHGGYDAVRFDVPVETEETCGRGSWCARVRWSSPWQSCARPSSGCRRRPRARSPCRSRSSCRQTRSRSAGRKRGAGRAFTWSPRTSGAESRA